MVRPLVIALQATGAAPADSTFVSSAAEPSSTPLQPPTIVTPELLNGTVSVGYGFTFEASNGAPPLHSREAEDAGVRIRHPWASIPYASGPNASSRSPMAPSRQPGSTEHANGSSS